MPSSEFLFLKLPAELRLRIYEFVLSPARRPGLTVQTPSDARGDRFVLFLASRFPGQIEASIVADVDAITLGNTLTLRKKLATGYSFSQFILYARALFINVRAKPGMAMRLHRAMHTLPPLRDTTILRVCKQIHDEARDYLYSTTTFAVITPTVTIVSNTTGSPFQECFPGSIQLARIQKLRLEILLVDTTKPDYTALNFVDEVFSSFKLMRDLVKLQVVVTYWTTPSDTPTALQRDHLLRIAQAIPAHVEVTWGMTERELEVGDYSGHNPIEGHVLREIVDEHVRGVI